MTREQVAWIFELPSNPAQVEVTGTVLGHPSPGLSLASAPLVIQGPQPGGLQAGVRVGVTAGV